MIRHNEMCMEKYDKDEGSSEMLKKTKYDVLYRRPLTGGLDRHVDVYLWPLTLKFDRVTRLFLKFDMRHGAYQHATGLSKI